MCRKKRYPFFSCMNVSLQKIKTIEKSLLYLHCCKIWRSFSIRVMCQNIRETSPCSRFLYLHVYSKMQEWCQRYMYSLKNNYMRWISMGTYMWTLPDDLGASRKCSPTPALPGVRKNIPNVKIQKIFFFFFLKFSRPSFLHICMVIMVTCCWKAINS